MSIHDFNDGLTAVNKFLAGVPDKWIMVLVCLFVALIFWIRPTEFSQQLLNTVISGLVGMLIGNRLAQSKPTPDVNIKAETVETGAINNEQMNATIEVKKENSNAD